MKTFLYLGSALIGGALMSQLPIKPPMKMGLWEYDSHSTMSGMELPKGMPPINDIKMRVCLTPESYAKAFTGQNSSGCTRTNESWSGKTWTFDMACRTMAGHFVMTFDSDESGHSVVHMTSTQPQNGHTIVVDGTSQAHYIGSDCGSVTPGHPDMQMH